MKILITTDLYTVTTNGVVTSVKNLTGELVAAGHEVRILTPAEHHHSRRTDNVYYIRSVPLGAVYPGLRMPTSYRHRLIRELIQWKPDVIHSQCEFFTYQYARRISKLTGAPIVHTYHTLYEQYVGYLLPIRRWGDGLVRNLSRWRLKRAACVIAPTAKVERTLRGYGMGNPIRVVPSGIRLAQHRVRITPEVRAARRSALGIRDGQTVLLNLGRLGTEKNLEELVRYFATALNRRPELVFLIVGDGPAKKDLEKLVCSLGLEKSVRFTGRVEPTQVQEYYQLADIFVSASTSETQGLTYIEAAANGLPLLCRQDPCLEEVLIPGGNGYGYTTEEEFLAFLDTMVADPHWRGAAGERSRQIAAGFDTNIFGRSVMETYRAAIAAGQTHTS